MNITELNKSAKKVHGADITLMVARAVAWGNQDNMILVAGRNHCSAAVDIARAALSAGMKPRVAEESSRFMGEPPKSYSTVIFT